MKSRSTIRAVRPETKKVEPVRDFFRFSSTFRMLHVMQNPNPGRRYYDKVQTCVRHGTQFVVQCQRPLFNTKNRARIELLKRRGYYFCTRSRCTACQPVCDCEAKKDSRRSVLMSRTRPARDQKRCTFCGEAGLSGHECPEQDME